MTSPSEPDRPLAPWSVPYDQPSHNPAEDVENPAMAAMETQVEGAWNMMLSQATAAGFTREQIISLTLSTAAAILDASAKALWPSVETPEGERYARYTYARHRAAMRADAVTWPTGTPARDGTEPITE